MPPHLPNPSCSIANHERFMRLKIFLLSTAAGLMAGLVGAVVMINAWYPTAFGNTTLVIPNRGGAPSLDASVVRDWRPRLISIYDENKTINQNYYLSSARVATAVVVNAGGWTVLPSIKINKTYTGVDYQGHKLTIEEVVADETNGLTFVKFSGADFRATASFAARSSVQTGRVLWGYAGDWEAHQIAEKALNPRAVQNGTVISVATEPTVYSFADLGAASRVLITDRGEFVGFSNANRVVVPVWMVGETLPKILSGQKPPFVNFNVQGSFVEAARTESNTTLNSGFLITEVTRTDKEPVVLKKGDIIVSINGQKVTADNLVELITFAPDTFTVTVDRNTILTELSLKK